MKRTICIGTVSKGNDKYDLVEDLAEQTAGVFVAHSTPEQLGLESHFARLRLLESQSF